MWVIAVRRSYVHGYWLMEIIQNNEMYFLKKMYFLIPFFCMSWGSYILFSVTNFIRNPSEKMLFSLFAGKKEAGLAQISN